MQTFNLTFNDYVSYFNSELDKTFNNLSKSAPSLIKEAMRYAIVDGGKRIRPIVCFACAKMLGIEKETVLPYAIAIEMIHSYSLVHDDLPAMDNDDYRRGKFSTHKKFGEANGILAGDGLLTLAFEICLSKKVLTEIDAKVARLIAEYAGYNGMIAGQILDLESENKQLTDKEIIEIYVNKTSRLLQLPLLISSTVAGDMYFAELKELGENLGIMFQITDDILDVEGSFLSLGKTPHKDEKSGKNTFVSLFGLSKTKEICQGYYDNCVNILQRIPNSEFLLEFVKYVYLRKN